MTISVRRFGEDQFKEFTLVGKAADVNLEVGNLCEDCLFAGEKTSYDLDEVLRDKDFCWYYELSSRADEIVEYLASMNRAALPVPVPAEFRKGGALGLWSA
ncbi:MAG TPA: hypothetical protein VKK31_05080 [Thermoanaerobaculia bacterium]|nr:hypothetical protein [Thermoanaerobaculia bacterium]